MKTRATVALGTLAGALMLTGHGASDYKPLEVDTANSRIGFTAATLLFSVDGQFKRYAIQVDGDPSNYPAAKVHVAIDPASVFTANSTRDHHLASPDFLDAERYPRIEFTSERITRTERGIEMTGTLTLHGRQRKVTVPFQVFQGKNGAGANTLAYKGRLAINRNDYGVGSDDVAAKISLRDEVTLDLLVLVFAQAR
jgi:polyisoprenoid-binding protein YceI